MPEAQRAAGTGEDGSRGPGVPRSRWGAEAAGAGKGAAKGSLRRRDRARDVPGQDPRRSGRSNSKASPLRRASGLRALEARLEAMELQLRQPSAKVGQIAQSGSYMATRRVGGEDASLGRELRTLYDARA